MVHLHLKHNFSLAWVEINLKALKEIVPGGPA